MSLDPVVCATVANHTQTHTHTHTHPHHNFIAENAACAQTQTCCWLLVRLHCMQHPSFWDRSDFDTNFASIIRTHRFLGNAPNWLDVDREVVCLVLQILGQLHSQDPSSPPPPPHTTPNPDPKWKNGEKDTFSFSCTHFRQLHHRNQGRAWTMCADCAHKDEEWHRNAIVQ